MKKIFVLVVFLLPLNLIGQDFVFIDYNQLPTLLNPANVGNTCGPRISSFGQSISSSSVHSPIYRTLGVNFDIPLELQNDFSLGAGSRYINEFSGSNLGTVGGVLGISIHKSLKTKSIDHTISIGLEGGITKTTLNDNDLRWPGQIGQNGFEPIDPSGESDLNVIYGDLSLGVVWSVNFSQNTTIRMGSSLYHVNRPNISFFGGENRLSVRSQYHAKLETKLTNKIKISPSLFYTKQATQDIYNFGLSAISRLTNKTELICGFGYVKNGQPYLTATLILPKLSIGINYGFKNDAGATRYEAILGYRFKKCS